MKKNKPSSTGLKTAVFTLLLSLACSAFPTTGPADLGKKPRIDIASLEKRIHVLINQERRQHGLPLLAWDSELASIARQHSRDMSWRKYFDHASPEGHDFLYRYRQAKYACRIHVDRNIYMGAENIALNYLYKSVTTINGKAYFSWNSQETIAQAVVQGWMKSRGHRENIMFPYFGHEGVGITLSPDDKVYITQNFC